MNVQQKDIWMTDELLRLCPNITIDYFDRSATYVRVFFICNDCGREGTNSIGFLRKKVKNGKNACSSCERQKVYSTQFFQEMFAIASKNPHIIVEEVYSGYVQATEYSQQRVVLVNYKCRYCGVQSTGRLYNLRQKKNGVYSKCNACALSERNVSAIVYLTEEETKDILKMGYIYLGGIAILPKWSNAERQCLSCGTRKFCSPGDTLSKNTKCWCTTGVNIPTNALTSRLQHNRYVFPLLTSEIKNISSRITVVCRKCGVLVRTQVSSNIYGHGIGCTCWGRNNTDWNKPCKVYALEITMPKGDSILKVGIASDVGRRIASLRDARYNDFSRHTITEIASRECATRYEAKEMENSIHDFLQTHHPLDYSVADVPDLSNGFTELFCFSGREYTVGKLESCESKGGVLLNS